MKAVPISDRETAVTASLAHILESPAFRGSRRCCGFLEYSVRHVLRGEQDELKERNIGVEVLHRPPDYDTSEDAIVRVTANEVRKRLAQYYQSAVADGGPVISLPPGSYAATIEWPAPAVVTAPPEPPARPRRNLYIAAALVLAAIVAALLLIPGRHEPSAVKPKGDFLWSRIFNPGQKTNIVMSDAAFREIQYVLGRDISLNEYLSPEYPRMLEPSAKPDARPMLAFLAGQQTTSVGSATLGARLLEFGHRLGGNATIRYPHHINAREFNTDNFILLGSRLSIPWVELFDPSLTFPLTRDPATGQFYLRNLAPRPGEQPEYRESADQSQTYADLALVPNPRATGWVLILNGIDMVAAETAGEFAMNGSLSTTLARAKAPAAEVLIGIRAIAGTPADVRVVAIHPIAPAQPR